MERLNNFQNIGTLKINSGQISCIPDFIKAQYRSFQAESKLASEMKKKFGIQNELCICFCIELELENVEKGEQRQLVEQLVTEVEAINQLLSDELHLALEIVQNNIILKVAIEEKAVREYQELEKFFERIRPYSETMFEIDIDFLNENENKQRCFEFLQDLLKNFQLQVEMKCMQEGIEPWLKVLAGIDQKTPFLQFIKLLGCNSSIQINLNERACLKLERETTLSKIYGLIKSQVDNIPELNVSEYWKYRKHVILTQKIYSILKILFELDCKGLDISGEVGPLRLNVQAKGSVNCFIIRRNAISLIVKDHLQPIVAPKFSKAYSLDPSVLRILLAGQYGAGKSSYLQRYTQDTFSEKYMSTIGIDFAMKVITINKKDIKLQIWDQAGAERFRTITESYYRGSKAFILVFDLTDRRSFLEVDRFMGLIRSSGSEEKPVVLLGTKLDICQDSPKERKVMFQEAIEKAVEHNIFYMEASSKTGQNIDEAMLKLVQAIESQLKI